MSKVDYSQPAQRRTIEQRRAQEAWEAIESMRNSDQKNDYGSRAKNFPAMVQTNGLGPAMAFLRAKAGTKHDCAEFKLFEHVEKRIINYLDYPNKDVMHLIQQADTDTYRRATAEAIAFGIWLRRYVEAEGWKASN